MNDDFTATYTWNNGSVYKLQYIQQDDGCFRIEILQQPDYGSRNSSLRTTGRQEHGGRFFIDTCGQKLSTLRSAELAAANWMFHTGRYIKTGESPYGYDDDFPPGCILWLG